MKHVQVPSHRGAPAFLAMLLVFGGCSNDGTNRVQSDAAAHKGVSSSAQAMAIINDSSSVDAAAYSEGIKWLENQHQKPTNFTIQQILDDQKARDIARKQALADEEVRRQNIANAKAQREQEAAAQAQQLAAQRQAAAQERARQAAANRSKREAIQAYWNRVTGTLAIAAVAAEAAGDAIKNDDAATASSLLAHSKEFAANAAEQANQNVPEGYDNVEAGLGKASEDLALGASKLRDYLDDSKPSEIADAKDDIDEANTMLTASQVVARSLYVKLGGKENDLASFADQSSAVTSMVERLSHH